MPAGQDQPDRLAVADPNQDFAGFLQAAAGPSRTRDRSEIGQQHHGAQDGPRAPDHRREHHAEGPPTRRGGTTRPPPAFLAGRSKREYAATRSRAPLEASMYPASSSIQRARSPVVLASALARMASVSRWNRSAADLSRSRAARSW